MKIILCGANGRMGKVCQEIIESGFCGAELAAVVDITLPTTDCPSYTSLSDVKEEADILIDFSHHSSTDSILAFAKARRMPVVIATTGQTEEEKAKIRAAAAEIPVFFSGNMSIGIALLISLAKKAASVFPDADVEIVETHHNRKLDVPSGTALMIAEGIREARGTGELCIGRHENGKRPEGEIGIHSLRLGNVVGEHEIRINTGTQTITLKHEAHSRALFAEGALTAAAFLIEQENGLFNVNDLFG
ncbi:MAG: 4-hydroxy-tetrahydrodipicolinate reductase [Ruminococcaceae bacterium]|nr:4-hydroxy-tetrahydrodipicolinate reductase [Oscillospiraceae bacterium]